MSHFEEAQSWPPIRVYILEIRCNVHSSCIMSHDATWKVPDENIFSNPHPQPLYVGMVLFIYALN